MSKYQSIDDHELARRVEALVDASQNRYRITVQVANRAKRRRYEEMDNIDESLLKPVKRAVVEMSDELTEPEIIGD
jgi:DNA-directed RNA polymerase subunit omega